MPPRSLLLRVLRVNRTAIAGMMGLGSMTRLRFAVLTVLALAVVFAVMFAAYGSSAEVRYKVTVEIDDNGTHRSGSSVLSFKLIKPTVALVSAYDAEFKGEAIAVDLQNQQVLFALLIDANGDAGTLQLWPEHLFEDLGSGSERIRNLRRIASNEGLSRELPRFRPAISDSREPSVNYALLVRFRALDRPESVETVAPDDLDQAFGTGVKLTRISVEITDEPVTYGIKTRLPWLEDVGRVRATLIPNPPRRLADSVPVQLVSPSDFTTELYK